MKMKPTYRHRLRRALSGVLCAALIFSIHDQVLFATSDGDYDVSGETGFISSGDVSEPDVNLSPDVSGSDACLSPDVSGSDACLSPDVSGADAEPELVGNIFGDVPAEKSHYYVTFTVNNDGEQRSWRFEQQYGTQKAVDDYSDWTGTSGIKAQVDAFLASSSEQTELVGWSVYTDSFNVSADDDETYVRSYSDCPTFLNPDASTYEYKGTSHAFLLSGTSDYHFVAQLSKAVADGLYITTIPSVHYDGRAHVAVGTKVNAKKQAADLRLSVYLAEDGKTLTIGKDYTVSYKNNVNASMRLIRESADGSQGSYTSLYSSSENNKRPKAIITGKGNYKGFSAEVYFDILPVSLGASEDITYSTAIENSSYSDSANSAPSTYTASAKAVLSGYDSSYLLKNGKLTSKIKTPKVTKEFYTYGYDSTSRKINATTSFIHTLKAGKDYTSEFYLWDTTMNCWVLQNVTDANQLPSKIAETTDTTAAFSANCLCVIRGIGNYCGAAYDASPVSSDGDSKDFDAFDPKGQSGTVMPTLDPTSPHQFLLTDDASLDFAQMKIRIGKKALPFVTDANGIPVIYRPTDFQITVTDIAGKVLTFGEDYTVRFIGKYRGYWYEGGAYAADEYEVQISPVSAKGYYGTMRVAGTVKITGLKLKAGFFKLDKKDVDFGKSAEVLLTDAGNRAGIRLLSDGSCDGNYDVRVRKGYSGYVTTGKTFISFTMGGSRYCGIGIDPSANVQLKLSPKPISLQKAIADGYIQFTVPETGTYNVKGAMPGNASDRIKVSQAKGSYTQYISLTYSGYRHGSITAYSPDGISIGREYLTFTVKNNKKVGAKATVIAKGSGMFKGSAVIGTFTVTPYTVKNISRFDINHYSVNNIYAQFTDAQYGKCSLEKPKVKLYQAYYDAKGTLKLAPLNKKQYTVDHIVAKSNGHCCTVYFADSDAFTFTNTAGAASFTLYDNAKLPAIKSVVIGGVEYPVKKGHIEGYTPSFTGSSIEPAVSALVLNDTDSTQLTENDMRITYAANVSAGKNKGSVTLTMQYNAALGRYPYKGKITLKFDILDTSGITNGRKTTL
ncbi:MAG: hypothetical protein IJ747_06050 [Lachnospiraceae bacterium]|nr:hypothetical protein [Lachnospiraceae bacterium]